MHVLFTTDGSEASERAIHEAVRLLPMAGVRATVLTVDDLAVEWPGPAAAVGAASLLAVREPQRLQDDLQRAAAIVRAAGAEVQTVRREGDAATRILQTADDLGVDLVVIGSHGRGALGRLLLGSVSTAILHGWPSHPRVGSVLVTGRPAS